MVVRGRPLLTTRSINDRMYSSLTLAFAFQTSSNAYSKGFSQSSLAVVTASEIAYALPLYPLGNGGFNMARTLFINIKRTWFSGYGESAMVRHRQKNAVSTSNVEYLPKW